LLSLALHVTPITGESWLRRHKGGVDGPFDEDELEWLVPCLQKDAGLRPRPAELQSGCPYFIKAAAAESALKAAAEEPHATMASMAAAAAAADAASAQAAEGAAGAGG